MSQPYVGEIRSFAGNFAPRDYHLCDGTLLPISQYEVLYTLLGTTFGGDGVTTFALPDLRGRMVISQGQGLGRSRYVMGQVAGTETVTLTQQNIPNHSHPVVACTSVANTQAPTNAFFAAPVDTTTTTNTDLRYLPDSFTAKTIIPLDPTTVTVTGGSLPHQNLMPVVAISYIIALFGIFPSGN
ncbi:phage tail protein [Mucilaginibacter sp. AW1-3]